MITQNVFVTNDDSILIRCPTCLKESIVPMHKINYKRDLKVRCTCDATFLLHVDFRKKTRKPADLAGYYERREEVKTSRENWDFKRINCTIKNITQDGLGIMTTKKPDLQVGNVIMVSFAIGCSSSTVLEKEVIVRRIDGNYLGCEFTEEHKRDKRIGFFIIS